MIIGYMLLASNGNLIIKRELIRLISEDYQSLFTGVITAINSVIEEVFQSKIRHLEMEKFHLYFTFGKMFTLVIISDIEDDRLINVGNEIINNVEKKFKYTEDQMIIDENIKIELQKYIEKFVYKAPPSIASVNRLARILLTTINLVNAPSIGFEEIVPGEYKVGTIKRISKLFRKKSALHEIIEDFYKGKFEKVIEKAETLFEDEEQGELARILYAKAALFLNSFHPRVKAPNLDEINTVINEIKDDISREYLKAELDSFITLGAYNIRRNLFTEKQLVFFEKISSSGINRDVYLLLITSLPYGPLLDLLEMEYKNKSEFLYALTIEMKFLLKILTSERLPASEVFRYVSDAYNLFMDAYKKKSLGMYSYFHMVLFSYAFSLLSRDMPFEDGYKILKRAFELYEQYHKELVDEALYSTNRHRAVNLYFFANVFMRLLLDINDDLIINSFDKIREYLEQITKWFIGLGSTRRITVDMYYVGLVGLISALARLSLERGVVYKELPKLLLKLSDPKMERFWEYNEYHYAHYYADLLDAIGNLAMFVEIKSIRTNLILQAAFGIERIARIFKETPMIYDFEILKSIRLYLLSGTEEGKKKAEKLLEELKEVSSPFIVKIAEKLFEKGGK